MIRKLSHAHYPEVRGPFENGFRDQPESSARNRKAHIFVQAAECFQRAHQKEQGNGMRCRYAHQTFEFPLSTPDGVNDRPDMVEKRNRPDIQIFPGSGYLKLFMATDEQKNIQAPLQILYVMADGGLPQPHVGSRPAHASQMDDEIKSAKPLEKIAVKPVDHGFSRFLRATASGNADTVNPPACTGKWNHNTICDKDTMRHRATMGNRQYF
jgi:hypothetical protein